MTDEELETAIDRVHAFVTALVGPGERTCDHCFGSGEVAQRDASVAGGLAWFECPRCDGDGLI